MNWSKFLQTLAALLIGIAASAAQQQLQGETVKPAPAGVTGIVAAAALWKKKPGT